MARIGLWNELVHRLGTLNVVPIMELRLVKPIAMNRYSRLNNGLYTEYWGYIRHGWNIDISPSRRFEVKVYDRDKRQYVYGNYADSRMKTLGFKLNGYEGRFKWKKSPGIRYHGYGKDPTTIVKEVGRRDDKKITKQFNWGQDIYYICQDLLKVINEM